MHHTNRNDVIEAGEDIQDILGVHVAEENGQKVATIKAILDPRKDFLAVKEFFLHLTNGINHKLLGPFTPVASPNDLPSAPDDPTQEAEKGPEATQPLIEPAPSKAEVSTNNSTNDDTVELPIAPATGKKGK